MFEKYEDLFRKALEKEIIPVEWNEIRNEIVNNLVKYIINTIKGKKTTFNERLLIPRGLVILSHPVFNRLCAGEGVWPNILGMINRVMGKKIKERGLYVKAEKLVLRATNSIIEHADVKRISDKKLRSIIKEEVERALFESGLEAELESLYLEIDDFFEGGLINFIYNKFSSSLREARKGLRPIIIPGSITRGKAFNLYFGEAFSSGELLSLAYMLLSSICIGDNIAIYLEGGKVENIMDEIKEKILMKKFDSRHVTGDLLKEFKIRPSESEKPYIVLVKFLLKLMEFYENALKEANKEESDLLAGIIEDIKNSHGFLYVVPKFKGERSVIPLPRLDRFIGYWLENKKKRQIFKGFLDGLYSFLGRVYSRARKERKQSHVENAEKVIANQLEYFLKMLIENNIIHWQSLRAIIDIVVELSTDFEIVTNLWPIKYLE